MQVPARRRSLCASHFGDRGGLVRRQVVQDDVHVQTAGHGGVDLLEERAARRSPAWPLRRCGVDLAGGDVHRREQIDGAVALVVMGHRAGPARLHRQRRLGAVQRLTLGLLIEAEHHRPRRRVEIQPDHVDQLLLEPRIVADLEGVHLPRLAGRDRPRSGPPRPSRHRRARPSTGSSSASPRPAGRRRGSRTAPVRRSRSAATACGPALWRSPRPRRPRSRRTGAASAAPCPRRPRSGGRSPRSRPRQPAHTSARACTTSRCGNTDERAIRSSSPRCSSVIDNAAATMNQILPNHRLIQRRTTRWAAGQEGATASASRTPIGTSEGQAASDRDYERLSCGRRSAGSRVCR